MINKSSSNWRKSFGGIAYGLVLLLSAAAPLKSQAQERVDILLIYSNFIASRVAALGCGTVDKATEPKFLSNLLTVTIRATQAFKERSQNLSDADVTNRVTDAQKRLEETVRAEIARNGCSSDRIQQLLKLYKIHSEMSLGG